MIRMKDLDTDAMADELLLDHSSQVCCVDFSSNGELIASTSEDKTVRLCDTSTSTA